MGRRDPIMIKAPYFQDRFGQDISKILVGRLLRLGSRFLEW